jgi:hypothetical protein
VQQPLAQPFGFGLGELAVEHQRLSPDDQIVGEQHNLQPHLALVGEDRLEAVAVLIGEGQLRSGCGRS